MKLITSTILLVVLFFSATMFQAQTKWVFHKSHNGANHSLFADANNNYGPGMVIPVEMRWPLSDIELKYQTFNNIDYPVVLLDTATNVMRFLDVNDSIIGCDKEFQKYLNQGIIIYDFNTSQYLVYQADNGQRIIQKFIPATDSLESWTNKNLIDGYEEYIFSEQQEKILVNYSYLDNQFVRKLIIPATIEVIKITQIDKTTEITVPSDNIQSQPQIHIKTAKELRKERKKNNKVVKRKGKKKENSISPILINPNDTSPKTRNKTPLLLIVFMALATLLFWLNQQRKIRKLKLN